MKVEIRINTNEDLIIKIMIVTGMDNNVMLSDVILCYVIQWLCYAVLNYVMPSYIILIHI